MKTALLPLCLLMACSSAPAATIETTTFASSLGVDLTQSTRLSSGLYVRDLSAGTGAPAVAGETITTRYTGWLVDGTQFDSNQNAGFQFQLGQGQVIAGWDQGIPGMLLGGTRQLIIPPSLGYGESGSGPIPGNAVMVFTVTFVSAP